jgi:phage/plasmid-like protein (TIGR03299 family)
MARRPNVFKGLINKEVTTFDEALEAYGIDKVDAEKVPLTYRDRNGNEVVSDRGMEVINNDIDRSMGLVGCDYKVVPYSIALSPIEPLIEKGAKLVAGGAPNNGERAYLIIEMPGQITLSAKDKIYNRVLMTSGHDGGACIECRSMPYRPINGTVMTVDASSPLKFKHTLRAQEKIGRARKIHKRVIDNGDEFKAGVQKLVTVPISDAQAMEFIAAIVGDGDSTRTVNVREDIFTVYKTTGIGTRLPQCKGTVFGLVQGIAEWADHHKKVRKSKLLDDKSAAISSHLIADAAKKKQKAWALGLYLAKNKSLRGASK